MAGMADSAGQPSMRVPPGEGAVYMVSEPELARRVLEATDTFRLAAMPEYVPGVSSSFFLAADMAGAEGAARCHKEMAAYLAPSRLPAIVDEFRAAAERVVAPLLTTEGFDLESDCLRPYGRAVASLLSGLPSAEADKLVAAMTVAADTTQSRNDASRHAILTWAWNRLHVYVAAGGPFGEVSLPSFALERGNVDDREIALLTMPLLEMAAYGRNIAIARAALTRYCGDGHRLVTASPDVVRNLAWQASGLIDGLFVTRVARRKTTLSGISLVAGDRVVIDVTAANRVVVGEPIDWGSTRSHLAFGWGVHACIARELSLQMNQAIISALAGRAASPLADEAATDHWLVGGPAAGVASGHSVTRDIL